MMLKRVILFAALLSSALAAWVITNASPSELSVTPSGCTSGDTVYGAVSATMYGVHAAANVQVTGTITINLKCSTTGAISQLNIAVDESFTFILNKDSSLDQTFRSTKTFSATCPSGCSGPYTFQASSFTGAVLSDNTVDVIGIAYTYWVGSSGTSTLSDPLRGLAVSTSCVISPTDPCTIGCDCFSFSVASAKVYTDQASADAAVWTNLGNPSAVVGSDITTLTFRICVIYGPACSTGVSYVAIGTAGLNVVYPRCDSTWTSPGDVGLKYHVYCMGTSGNPGFTSIKWQPTSGSWVGAAGKGNCETFVMQVQNYPSNYLWTIQGHIGGSYQTFTAVDYSQCSAFAALPPGNTCPAGYMADTSGGCTACDTSVSGYQWVCVKDPNVAEVFYLQLKSDSVASALVAAGDAVVPGTNDGNCDVSCDCKTSNCAVPPPPPSSVPTCGDWGTCEECQANDCVWCQSSTSLSCTPSSICDANSVLSVCGDGATSYVPPTDSCPIGENGEICNGQGTCLQNSNGYYCDCDGADSRGLDCGSGGLTAAQKAAIAGGVLAAIIIAAIIALIIFTVAGLKGAQMLFASDLGMAAATTSPIHEEANKDQQNPMFSQP